MLIKCIHSFIDLTTASSLVLLLVLFYHSPPPLPFSFSTLLLLHPSPLHLLSLHFQEAHARYMKKHLAGETQEAQADLARLAVIRKQREEAAAKKAAAAEAAAGDKKS